MEECCRRGISKLWSDRLVPIGNGEDISELSITANELPSYIKTMKKAQGGFVKKLLYPKTQFTMNRALQFINSNGAMYSCSAGDSLITVDEFGKIMSCRRRPIVCEDVFNSALENVYYNAPVFKELRGLCAPDECSECKYSYYCQGGARCQSYASYGTYYRADPACVICR